MTICSMRSCDAGREVQEARQLKDQVTQLQNEVFQLRSSGLAPGNRDFSTVVGGEVPVPSGPPAPAVPATRGETMTSHTLDTGGSRNDTLTDIWPLQFRYRYLSEANGPDRRRYVPSDLRPQRRVRAQVPEPGHRRIAPISTACTCRRPNRDGTSRSVVLESGAM